MTPTVTTRKTAIADEALKLQKARGYNVTDRRCCRACGQVMASNLPKHVLLPPMKAQVFTLIRERPGISGPELCLRLYKNTDNASLNAARVHVAQLRRLLVGSGLAVSGRHHWRLLPEEPQ